MQSNSFGKRQEASIRKGEFIKINSVHINRTVGKGCFLKNLTRVLFKESFIDSVI